MNYEALWLHGSLCYAITYAFEVGAIKLSISIVYKSNIVFQPEWLCYVLFKIDINITVVALLSIENAVLNLQYELRLDCVVEDNDIKPS